MVPSEAWSIFVAAGNLAVAQERGANSIKNFGTRAIGRIHFGREQIGQIAMKSATSQIRGPLSKIGHLSFEIKQKCIGL